MAIRAFMHLPSLSTSVSKLMHAHACACICMHFMDQTRARAYVRVDICMTRLAGMVCMRTCTCTAAGRDRIRTSPNVMPNCKPAPNLFPRPAWI